MPPARKKRGAAAAAAAAAAQWKVGDLVLAKMKGFPAWPAMITEPQQWNLPAAKKNKLLVCFYGTKEIAFCSYADLEAFTEEKKKSLLVKRHGKGADFVRAVKEIVEVYDSLKKETDNGNDKSGSTENNLRTDFEKHVNNSSSLDTVGPEDGSDLANGNKMEDCPTSSMDHSMVSTPRPNINTMEGEHCVVNSAHGDPIEKSPILHESRHSPLHTSSCSKKRQEDSQQQDSWTHGNFALAWRSGSSFGSELITCQDDGDMMNGMPSVDLIPGDNQEDSARNKRIEDDKPSLCSPSATKEAVLSHSSQGTCSQLAASGTSNDDKEPSSANNNVQCTCSNELSHTGVRDKEVKLSGTVDLPMSTTRTFKRKRRPISSRANNPVSSEVTNMDSELQPKSNGDLVYSPNSRNEINKSDGDEHLPLVKRARVRMERPTLENATVDEPGHSYDKTEPTKHEDLCYKHAMPAISGKDKSDDYTPPGIDASPKINHSVSSGEVQNSCNNNKEYQPKVLTLDIEAALPPSKRLHRALEAMSANRSETVSNPPEATESNEVTLKGCTASSEMVLPNNSADAFVKSPKSAMAKSPMVSLSAKTLDAPTGQVHITQAVMFNKDALSPVSSDLRNDISDYIRKDKVSEEACMDSENLPDSFVHTGIDSDDCEKTPTCSMKLEESAFESKIDQLPSHKASGNEPKKSIEGSANASGKTIDVSADVSDCIRKHKVSEEACMDSENVPDSFVHTEIDSDDCGKTPSCSMKLEESAFESKFDQLPSHKASGNEPKKSIEGSANASDKTIDVSADVSDCIPKDKVSEEACMDSENVPDSFVYTEIDSDDCGKTPSCSMKLEESAFESKFDRLPSHKESGDEPKKSIEAPTNADGKTIDVSAKPVSQANALVSSYTRGTCDPVLHDDTVLAESIVNVCDRTGTTSLASKVSYIHSERNARTFESHSSPVIAPEDLDPGSLNLKDKSLSPDSMPTKGVVVDGHARGFSQSNSFMNRSLDSKLVSEPLVNISSLKEGSNGQRSPSHGTIRSASDRFHSEQDSGEIHFDNLQLKGLAGRNEANSSRRVFEAFVGTLTRTKESISRATRLALDCAKHGIAGEVMDIIIEHLEKETNLNKRVDLFFLVDSIIRYCRNQKGGPGDAYPSLIQAVLPRIIYASAPPGNSAWENRRQCLKVLRLWLERKTLSEYIIRHHIKELEALNDASFGSSHRPSGTERALNDPLRDNEAFLVDEYGSNAGFHLPNLISTKLLEDEDGRSSEERSFEGLTPEHEVAGATASEQEVSQLQVTKHQLILEEVDGELEMEDAAPSSGAEASSIRKEDLTNNAICTGTAQQLSSIPPLPDDKAPSPPPLPSSPPPLPRPPCPEQQHPGANYNVEGQHRYSVANSRGNMDACVASSQHPVSYNSGYTGHNNQIFQPPPPPPPPTQPIATFHPSGPHGTICGPSVPQHGNNYHQPPSAPLPNSAYHLQPPPRLPGPNQFPYPPEPEQRTQPWNYGPPYPESYQYGGPDRGHHGFDRRPQFDDRGHHFDDRGHRFDGGGHYFDDGMHHFDDRWHHFHDRGQMHHEVMDGGRFPPFFPPGPPFPDHFEAPPNQFHCGRPLEPPPGLCSGWPMPHRRSKYPPDSRQTMEPPVSNGGGWRRHGRQDYDRYH